MATFTLNAADWVTEEGTIIASAEKLAHEVLKRLEKGPSVEISLRGLRGLSSSYFNAFLLTISQKHDLKAIQDRIKFLFDSNVQETVFRRSLASFEALPRN